MIDWENTTAIGSGQGLVYVVADSEQERERTLQVQVGIAATEALQSAENEEDLRPAWERVREHFDTVTATPEGVDALRQSILQLAVQGRLTERDPEDTPADVLLEQIQQEKQRLYDAGEIRKPKDLPKIGDEGEKFDLPSQWVLTRLGRLIHFKNGYAFRSKNYSDEGVGIVKIGDIQDGEVTEQDMDRLPTDLAKKKIEKYNVEPGALLIGMSGSVGKLGFNTSEKTYLLNQRVGKITPISALTGSVSKRYIYHFLRTRVDENLRIAEGSAIKNLSTTQIKETPIPLPPPEEQRRLVEIVDLLMSFCNDLGELLSDSSERGEQLLEAALKDASVDRSDAAPTGATA
jgi:type I restriction enzyme S subunit